MLLSPPTGDALASVAPPAQVAVTLPDVRGRQEILDLYLAGKPVAPDVDTGG